MQDSILSKTGAGMQTASISSDRSNAASNDTEYVTFPIIFRWLLVLFTYGWWLIVIEKYYLDLNK